MSFPLPSLLLFPFVFLSFPPPCVPFFFGIRKEWRRDECGRGGTGVGWEGRARRREWTMQSLLFLVSFFSSPFVRQYVLNDPKKMCLLRVADASLFCAFPMSLCGRQASLFKASDGFPSPFALEVPVKRCLLFPIPADRCAFRCPSIGCTCVLSLSLSHPLSLPLFSL